jgi:N-acetyltransferase
MKTSADFQRMVERHGRSRIGESMAFATKGKNSGRVIGGTGFINIDRTNRRSEIGSSWIALSWRRTAVNTEAR